MPPPKSESTCLWCPVAPLLAGFIGQNGECVQHQGGGGGVIYNRPPPNPNQYISCEGRIEGCRCQGKSAEAMSPTMRWPNEACKLYDTHAVPWQKPVVVTVSRLASF